MLLNNAGKIEYVIVMDIIMRGTGYCSNFYFFYFFCQNESIFTNHSVRRDFFFHFFLKQGLKILAKILSHVIIPITMTLKEFIKLFCTLSITFFMLNFITTVQCFYVIIVCFNVKSLYILALCYEL